MSDDANDAVEQPNPSDRPGAPPEASTSPPEGDREPAADPPGHAAELSAPNGAGQSSGPSTDTSGESDESQVEGPQRRKILIGSQRDPAAYRTRPKRDWTPVDGEEKKKEDQPAESTEATDTPSATSVAQEGAALEAEVPPIASEDAAGLDVLEEPVVPVVGATGQKKFPPPNIRGQLPADLEAEFEQALGDVPLEDLIADTEGVTKQQRLEPDSKHVGRVVAVGREDVFVELGAREQGILPVRQFSEPPDEAAEVQVRVVRFNPEDGLYELALPQAAADVSDWSDLEEGMLVEARITGHNSGGLECEVNHIRGFIPVSQISLYRVEDLDQFVGEKFACLVTEVNPMRRNLVLSRRAVLEREKEEARKQLLDSLEPGQVRDGVVRKLMDFGAFVDLGGVDGLLHISQLGWGRVHHPREVLEEGQAIQVKIEKIDEAKGRISLLYRDMLPNPWEEVERKFPPNTAVTGKVVKLMEFGAFVELEPGVEGLVHISELSHKKVWRVGDIVNEGDEVEVAVLSVDPQAQRISLSMKHLSPEPEKEEQGKPRKSQDSLPADKSQKKWTKPLRGGIGHSTGGEQFGLKW